MRNAVGSIGADKDDSSKLLPLLPLSLSLYERRPGNSWKVGPSLNC